MGKSKPILPIALSVSLGMLFPAISSLSSVRFCCIASSRDRPPSKPMLFHLRSAHTNRSFYRTLYQTRQHRWQLKRKKTAINIASITTTQYCKNKVQSSFNKHLDDIMLTLLGLHNNTASVYTRQWNGFQQFTDLLQNLPNSCKVVFLLSAIQSSAAPWWLIWLLRRSSWVREVLEAKPSQNMANPSSHIPRAFHSSTSLQKKDTIIWLLILHFTTQKFHKK